MRTEDVGYVHLLGSIINYIDKNRDRRGEKERTYGKVNVGIADCTGRSWRERMIFRQMLGSELSCQ